MEIKDKITFFIFLMLVLGGTLFAFITWLEWRSVGRIIKLGELMQGVVIEMFRRPRKVGETAIPNSFAPVVLFTTSKGEQRNHWRRPGGRS